MSAPIHAETLAETANDMERLISRHNKRVRASAARVFPAPHARGAPLQGEPNALPIGRGAALLACLDEGEARRPLAPDPARLWLLPWSDGRRLGIEAAAAAAGITEDAAADMSPAAALDAIRAGAKNMEAALLRARTYRHRIGLRDAPEAAPWADPRTVVDALAARGHGPAAALIPSGDALEAEAREALRVQRASDAADSARKNPHA